MIWILTREHNDYDQHGEYYVMAWRHEPTPSELLKAGVPESDVTRVMQGGGRENNEGIWFNLFVERNT